MSMRNKDEVAAKFVGCWEIGKRLIACLDAISQFCRGLRILNGRRGQSPCGHFPSASREDLSMGGES